MIQRSARRGTSPFREYLLRRFRLYSSPSLHAGSTKWDFQLVPAAEHVPNVFLGPATQIACYSRLEHCVVKYDNTLLRRFRWPAPGRNLAIGINLYATQDPYRLHEAVRVDHMLEACLEHGNRHSWLRSDVIATSDALSKYVCSFLRNWLCNSNLA